MNTTTNDTDVDHDIITDTNTDHAAELEKDPPDSGHDDSAMGVRSLLRRALTPNNPANVDLLPRVQREIRRRSRGKYYADGWSITNSPPSTFIVTSLLMLIVMLSVIWAMIPVGWVEQP